MRIVAGIFILTFFGSNIYGQEIQDSFSQPLKISNLRRVPPDESGWIRVSGVGEDGRVHNELVPIPGSFAERELELIDEKILVHRMRTSGLSKILTSLSIEDIELFCQPELLDKQRSDLLEIIDSFRSQVADAEPKEVPAIRTKCLLLVSDTLLPDQKQSLARKFSGTRLITPLLTTDYADKMEITADQRNKIIERCKRANEAVKAALAEQQLILERCRDELRSACEDVLTKEQLRKIDVERQLKKMSIDDLDADTEFEVNE
ncbi:hypothetical protein [Mariniblastus fucicola]|uniref:Uncharacterized protein n=1 Tax=Mariniblastus fucicola TaxID=980251 RepID=A0A5B9P8D9_9BACT|nr:hypothetical protein [Mariniblastus fucicola]QEG22614.1 hypothetical protein MFFC18_24970 [Mariniblastus fucicola]